MLIKRIVLDKIVSGEIDLAFRRWRRPTVKPGGRLRTAVGQLAIDEVMAVPVESLTEDDARRAGYQTFDELKADISARRDGELYRISLRYQGPDRRDRLREDDGLGNAESAKIMKRLARLDGNAPDGARALILLGLIALRPEEPAQVLAATTGTEKPWLKRRIRKLKELGLTESMRTGYRLSPRGRRLLAYAEERERAPEA